MLSRIRQERMQTRPQNLPGTVIIVQAPRMILILNEISSLNSCKKKFSEQQS